MSPTDGRNEFQIMNLKTYWNCFRENNWRTQWRSEIKTCENYSILVLSEVPLGLPRAPDRQQVPRLRRAAPRRADAGDAGGSHALRDETEGLPGLSVWGQGGSFETCHFFRQQKMPNFCKHWPQVFLANFCFPRIFFSFISLSLFSLGLRVGAKK